MTDIDKAYLRLHLGILLAGATGIFGRLISLSELPLAFIFSHIYTLYIKQGDLE